MGRSRGGLTTKIHALVDAEGRPVKLILTPGQAGDAPAAARTVMHEGTVADDDRLVRPSRLPSGGPL